MGKFHDARRGRTSVPSGRGVSPEVDDDEDRPRPAIKHTVGVPTMPAGAIIPPSNRDRLQAYRLADEERQEIARERERRFLEAEGIAATSRLAAELEAIAAVANRVVLNDLRRRAREEDRRKAKAKANAAKRKAQEAADEQHRQAIYEEKHKQWLPFTAGWQAELDRRQIGFDKSQYSVQPSDQPRILALAKRQKQTLLMQADSRLQSSALEQSGRIFPALVEQLSPTLPFHELETIETNARDRRGGARGFHRWWNRTELEEQEE